MKTGFPSLETYNGQRRLVQVLSTIAIVLLPFFNILRLDVPTLRFYFFNTVLWLDEFSLLFLAGMLGVFLIVVVSMVYGRVWCGWACPQTVLSELSHWFENKTRAWLAVPRTGGSRWSARRLAADGLFFAGVAAVSASIAFNQVAFFVDPYRMLQDIMAGTLDSVIVVIMAGITLLMVVNIIFWREKFCTKACPYAMLQAVLTDKRTQIVRYQTERAEECIECKACVRDCMMGIDIRTSPYQTECIHCGVCVDSCTAILGRLKKPIPTLITFAWGEQDHKERTLRWYEKLGLVDAKRWIALGILLVYLGVFVAVIQARQPLGLTASGDRSTLFRTDSTGTIYNDYIIKISNRSMEDGTFTLGCAAEAGHDEHCTLHIAQNPIMLRSREVKTLAMTISTDGRSLKPGPNRLTLQAASTTDADVAIATEIVFFMPEKNITSD